MPTLLDRLRHLPQHSIVFYTSLSVDAKEQSFINATQSVPMVAQAANAPVYGMADTFIGQGVVGGFVSSYAAQINVATGMIRANPERCEAGGYSRGDGHECLYVRLACPAEMGARREKTSGWQCPVLPAARGLGTLQDSNHWLRLGHAGPGSSERLSSFRKNTAKTGRSLVASQL